eukprot:scaffold247812_cov45-Prasinocladus_malaysianus.AAC.1
MTNANTAFAHLNIISAHIQDCERMAWNRHDAKSSSVRHQKKRRGAYSYGARGGHFRWWARANYIVGGLRRRRRGSQGEAANKHSTPMPARMAG